MNSVIDLAASFVVGGFLLLSILAVQSNLVESCNEYSLDLVGQESIATLAELLVHDMRKIGCGAPVPENAVLAADSISITFLADLESDGFADTVYYAVSDTVDASGTENPVDRLFYRRVNGLPAEGVTMGVTDFILAYRDASGLETTTPSAIRIIDIRLTVESLSPYGDRYASTSWECTVRPRSMWIN